MTTDAEAVVSHMSLSYRRYALGALTLVYTLNFLDRGLMILLLQSVKDDLHLSDTQLGFLTGIAYAIFYAVLGLPIARWADRANRVTLTAIAIGLWGLTVAACLLVVNFTQLVLARIAAAVGESGCMPPTYSLVGDYFPRATERTRAIAVYMLAGPLATLMSFIAGGALNARFGWRITFALLGAPAFLAAVLIKVTVTEPRATGSHAQGWVPRLPGVSDILKVLWERRSTRHLSIAITLLFTMGFGLAPWYAAFMIRSHGMSTPELGLWLGLIFGATGALGILIGGYATSRWFVGDERGQMRLSATMIAGLVPCYVLFLLVPGRMAALISLVPLMIVFNFFCAPAFALMQRLVIDEMRATTLAVVMLLVNLIGMGVGPQVVGILSDVFALKLGADSLRYSMLMVSFIALWAAYHFWQVGTTVSEDLAAVNRGISGTGLFGCAGSSAPVVRPCRPHS